MVQITNWQVLVALLLSAETIGLVILLIVGYFKRNHSYERNGITYVQLAKGFYINFTGILLLVIIQILIIIYLLI